MLLYGSLKSKKTEILIENYARLLNSGVKADEILVIVQNSKMKKEFIEGVKKHLKINALSKFEIYSYYGLCYNTVLAHYPVLENKINKGKAEIFPYMCTLEASNYIFKSAIDKLVFRGYNSKTNLLHQLLRRQSLITLNALDDEEVKERTKVLRESFSLEIKKAIDMYKSKTLEFRAFDYLRQVQLFSYLYKNIKNPYKYVFVDDADEVTPSFFEYLKFIKKDVKEFFIGYDPLGTSRKGYLCGVENNFELFLNETPIVLEEDKTCDLIFESVKAQTPFEFKNLIQKDFIKADEMTESLIEDINSLLNSGVRPKDILVIIPEDNEFLKLYLSKISSNINFITGSEKIEENRTVSLLISLLKILIEGENYKISPYKLHGLLGSILKVDLNSTIKIVQEFEAGFLEKSIFEILKEHKDEGEIEKFLNLYENCKDKKLSELLYSLSNEFVEKTDENRDVIQKINQLLGQLADFENIFKNNFSKKELLSELENTIISENPLENNQLEENAVNVSTFQKAIDFKIFNKYLFLFDTSNSNWTKQDIGPLYNSWVFSKSWIKKDFTLEDNINLSYDKLARTLRKIFLLNNGEIRSYSSVYNFLGTENFKGIKHLFKTKAPDTKGKFKIIPREDQKPVLEYSNGHLAVVAVAGAGKTTVMLALILKLLERGVYPSNIFVLTYMESAARTFRERIKGCFPDMSELPNISTIHGLSMRILRENNNHAHLGLDVDFDIIDEIKKIKVIGEILHIEGVETSKANIYVKAISAFKNSAKRNEALLSPLFRRIYEQYQKQLKNLNLIDYDDLLILSLELLKQNSKIREYYQDLAHFVIEDEAQDSSSIQQELISIISKKHGNLIRCGDINQSITGTFTNSDTKGFLRFIENNPNCRMNYTLRNSTGVIDLANKLIKGGLKISKSSFLDIETKPVEGKNTIDPNACYMKVFEDEGEEKKFIKEKIDNIFLKDNTASIAILTRTNREGENWVQYLKKMTDYKISSKTGLLSDNPVFIPILAVFNFLSNPMNNSLVVDFAQKMMGLGFYTSESKIFDYIKNLNSPFILENNDEYGIWWDLRYFLELTTLTPFELAFKIGEFYFINDKKRKSNIALVSSVVSKIYRTETNFEDTLYKMNELNKKKISLDIKFFEEDEEKKETEVKILTIHKSKGDEYDYVFIPALNKENLGLNPDEVTLKDGTRMLNGVRSIKKAEGEIKNEIIDENLRLLYVGITRAKKKLYLTSSNEFKKFNKKEKTKPSKCFEILGSKN